MNTISILFEQTFRLGHKGADSVKVITDYKVPVKSKRYEALRIKIYREILETVKSVLMVFVVLAVYRVTGLYNLYNLLVINSS